MSNSLHLYQAWCSVGLNLGPKCLQSSTSDVKMPTSRYRLKQTDFVDFYGSLLVVISYKKSLFSTMFYVVLFLVNKNNFESVNWQTP